MKLEFKSAGLAVAMVFAGVVLAQGTLADYERAQGLTAKARGLVVNQPGGPKRVRTLLVCQDRQRGLGIRFGGRRFRWPKSPAFDHDKLATAINAASGGHYTGVTLPFAPPAGRRGGSGGRGASSGCASDFSSDLLEQRPDD
jgi:hypothetical protein